MHSDLSISSADDDPGGNSPAGDGGLGSPARARLVHIAAALFRDKGYARTTVRDIAAAAGLRSGSLFHHFTDKEDILHAVMHDTIMVISQQMRTRLAATGGAQNRLLALIECELESILGQTSAAMTVLVYEWRSLSAARQGPILDLRAQYEAIWLEVIQECRSSGLITMEAALLRRFLTGALSWTVTWYRSEGALDIRSLAQSALELALSPASHS